MLRTKLTNGQEARMFFQHNRVLNSVGKETIETKCILLVGDPGTKDSEKTQLTEYSLTKHHNDPHNKKYANNLVFNKMMGHALETNLLSKDDRRILWEAYHSVRNARYRTRATRRKAAAVGV
jgi:hypothetical protein